jgi:LuxR family maltose regulon positive regulatory protein
MDAVDPRLQPPPLRRDVVVRDRLVRRLTSATDGCVVAIVATPGYGKTTLLAQWADAETRPVAWVSLDGTDVDPHVFVEVLARSIDGAIGLPPDVVAACASGAVPTLSVAVPRLARALHAAARPMVILVDDLHVIEGSPSADALGSLIAYQPPSVTIGLSGRSDAGLPFARLRVAGRLQELHETDLALDERESVRAIHLLDRGVGVGAAKAIHRRTEGWPAALYLATRAGQRPTDDRGGDDGDVAVADVPRPADRHRLERDLADYLDAELLAHKDRRTREFLRQTSILEVLTPGLCDAVTGSRGSGAILQRLAASDHLVSPLDSTGDRYRYHSLLRAHLLGQLDGDSGDIAALHRRAAVWLGEHGQDVAAVDHLLVAGDQDAAASRISTVALGVYRDGRATTVERWIRGLDTEILRAHPYVAAVGGVTDVLDGRSRRAEDLADLLETVDVAAGVGHHPPAFAIAFATLRALMARNGLAVAVVDARRAAAIEGDGWRPIGMATLGCILAASGQPDEAAVVLHEAASLAEAFHADRAAIAIAAQRSLIAAARDEWVAAANLARDAVDIAERLGLRHNVLVALAFAAAARVAIRRGDVAGARRHLAGLQDAGTSLSVSAPWLSVTALLEGSRAHLALSDPAGARASLRHAEDILAHRPDMGPLADEVALLRQRIRALPPGPGGASTLTPAEIRVLRLLPTYLSVPEIADRLTVSSNTIRTQVQSIYGKLGATSRTEAVERAIEYGLLEPLPVLAIGGLTSS